MYSTNTHVPEARLRRNPTPPAQFEKRSSTWLLVVLELFLLHCVCVCVCMCIYIYIYVYMYIYMGSIRKAIFDMVFCSSRVVCPRSVRAVYQHGTHLFWSFVLSTFVLVSMPCDITGRCPQSSCEFQSHHHASFNQDVHNHYVYLNKSSCVFRQIIVWN